MIVCCTIFSWTRSAWNFSLNLNQRFRAIKRLNFAFYTSKTKRNGGSYKYWHANSGIFARNEAEQTMWSERTTRRTHEIRWQRVSCMISPLEALLSELVCHTVHLPSFCNIIRSVYGENIQKFTTSKYHYTYEWRCNGVCRLQQACSWPWHACRVGLPAPPFSQCRNSHTRHSTQPWLAWMKPARDV